MNFFALSCLLTSFFSLLLGLMVVRNNHKSRLHKNWFFVSFFTALWSFGLWGVVTAVDDKSAYIFESVVTISAILIPIFYFKFISVLLGVEFEKKYIIRLSYFVGSLVAVVSFFPVFRKEMINPGFGFNYWVNPGELYFIFPIFQTVLVIYSLYLILKAYSGLSGVLRTQARYIFIAGAVGFSAAFTNYFPQVTGSYPLGNFVVIAYVIVVAYAILRHRLMGIRVIASKIYIYGLVGIFSYGYYHLITFVNLSFFGGVYTESAVIMGAVFAVIFAIIFLPLLNKIQTSSDVLFYRGNNPKKIFKDLALELSKSINIDELLETLNAVFKRVLATDSLDVYLFKKENSKRQVCVSILRNKTKRIKLGGEICSAILQDVHPVLVREELEKQNKLVLADELSSVGAKIVAPLVLRDKVIGMIFLGEKLDGDAYTQEDIEFLEIISSQAAVAIENARLYDEISHFSGTLQQKVDEQTKDIKAQAEHLQKLMEMRSEFLDITSHQLRTPVSVIKGVLSMIEEGSIPPARMSEFIRGAMEKAIKLGEIINDILRASEMDSDKFTMKVRPTDINEMLEKLQEDKRRTAEMKKLTMIYNIPHNIPMVMTDPKYVEHAIVNLVNNALQYTVEGSITTSVEIGKTHVILRVADTGIGIPPEAEKKLFQKFSRADNAVTTFTDGTGLGLFIIKQIIDANPGAKIEIEKTEVGKGTTFALWLPIAKEVMPAV